MNQVTLNTFLAIIETRNLNHAANSLNVTQSTVSARLNALEDELGQALFHRKKSGAELTSAGFKLERYARLMTDLWRQAKQETSLPNDVEYVCNFGCHPDIWQNFGKEFFQSVRKRAPNAALSIWQAEHNKLKQWLSTGLIDAAICYDSLIQGHHLPSVLHKEQLVLVSTIKRPLMRWDPNYVYVDYGQEFRRNHAATYADGDTPMTVFNSPAWALDYLMLNKGSGYLPLRLIEEHLHNQTLHLVAMAPEFTQTIYLVTNPDVTDKWIWLKGLISEISSATGHNLNV